MTVYDRKVLAVISNGTEYRTFNILTPADRFLFTAKEAITINSISYMPNVAGTDPGTVTAMIEKCPAGTAVGSGTDLLQSTINLKSTAGTEVSGTLVTSSASLTLAVGDRLGLDVTGTTSAVDGYFTIGYAKVQG